MLVALGGAVASALAPARANAAGLGLPTVPGLDSAAGDIVTKGFEFIVESLFGGDPAAEFTTGLVRWLVTIPNFSGGSVAEMEETTAAIALGSFAAIMTLAAVRFYFAGFLGSDGFEPLQAIGRGVVAAIAIACWPFLFDAVSALGGAISSALLSSPALKASISELLGAGIGGLPDIGDGLPLILGIVMAIAGVIAVIALVAVKIVISAITVVIYIAAPLAFAAWVIPELSWVASMLMRVLVGVLCVPVMWTLVFLAFGALASDTVLSEETAEGAGIAGELADAAIIKPLVALALLYMVIVGPKWLLSKVPLMGGGGGGAIRSLVVPYAISSGVSKMASGGGGSGTGARFPTAPTNALASAVPALAGAGAAGGGGVALASRGGAAVGGTGGAAQGASAAASAVKGGSGAAATDRFGGPQYAMDQARHDAAKRDAAAMRGASTRPSAEGVRAAYERLPAGLQRAASSARESATHEEARAAAARWAQAPGASEYRDELIAIGSANEGAWREGVPVAGQSAESQRALAGATGQRSQSKVSAAAFSSLPEGDDDSGEQQLRDAPPPARREPVSSSAGSSHEIGGSRQDPLPARASEATATEDAGAFRGAPSPPQGAVPGKPLTETRKAASAPRRERGGSR